MAPEVTSAPAGRLAMPIDVKTLPALFVSGLLTVSVSTVWPLTVSDDDMMNAHVAKLLPPQYVLFTSVAARAGSAKMLIAAARAAVVSTLFMLISPGGVGVRRAAGARAECVGSP